MRRIVYYNKIFTGNLLWKLGEGCMKSTSAEQSRTHFRDFCRSRKWHDLWVDMEKEKITTINFDESMIP